MTSSRASRSSIFYTHLSRATGICKSWKSISTAHIRRKGEGNIFSLFTSVGGGGRGTPSSRQVGGTPFPSPDGGTPFPGPGEGGGQGSPIQVRSQDKEGGARQGYPHPGQIPGQGGRGGVGYPL